MDKSNNKIIFFPPMVKEKIKPIVWQKSIGQYSNGQVAYCGTIKIGGYSWNGIDSSKGRYRVHGNFGDTGIYANTDQEAKEKVEKSFKDFVDKITL